MKQISSGSVAGLAAGLVIASFSRVLVVVIGLCLAVAQISSRYGLNVFHRFNVNKQIKKVASLDRAKKVFFKASFTAGFIMTAFVRL
jgi:uncharacterized membrane protein (Fun14 family)